MYNISSILRRDAASNNAAPRSAPAAAQDKAAGSRDGAVQRTPAKASKASSGLLCGLVRPSGKPASLTQVLHADAGQRQELTKGFTDDLTEGNTASRHEQLGVSRQFISDAPRSNIFLVPQGGRWSTAEDLRPRDGASLGDAVQKLVAFCDGDAEWAFRLSQYANQNLANRAWSAGLIGGQGLDGRSYKGRKILRCTTLQGDAQSPQHERLELHRTSADSIRLQWHRSRDVASLHLQGRDKPKKLGSKDAGYAVTLSVDIDRPQVGAAQPARLHEATLRSTLPRPLDA